MFGFQHDSIHVSKDDAYDDNNVVKKFNIPRVYFKS